MRLGGPILEKTLGPEEWAAAVRARGYRAAYCPISSEADDATMTAYARAAQDADLVIAEVGAWSNPISPDEATRRAAITYCQERLALAERIGARCCVNIAGSRGSVWCGPHPDNLSEATFDLIVATVREIMDAVQPIRTYYTIEMMEWVFPDTADNYLRLLKAIERPRLAVHMDPVNLIYSPHRYFANAAIIRDAFAKLGPYVRSCHAKDITLTDQLTVHLDERRPGLGALDYGVYLSELSKLDADVPLMMEHLHTEEEYRLAAEHIRSVAHGLGIAL
jgi:sugar phosphate isomerase/epimerase